MSADFSLSPLIAATAHWLTRAYPADGGALQRGLAEAQARQAVTVAAWLCYPTELDAQLVALTGPGGSDRLDRIAGTDAAAPSGHGAGGGVGGFGEEAGDGDAWRTWVDEIVASWAACLLSHPHLAAAAARALARTHHGSAVPLAFHRLTRPTATDLDAAALMRHPDLLAPIAQLHRPRLLARLEADTAPAG
ncbi:hypothetical protein OG444_02150 [Streptomyces sp. NBC_01232]|uniref:hypothetical protein n=1 Tax=Streptomyces sp. NBC_01232 TaxID=2903786 RepID=UPI002E0FDEB1|nr:hypothetical protein OG444_02150 [Streptomyces sp. NBC_01232]